MAGKRADRPRKPKFFRVLLPGFSDKLSLPHLLTQYFIREDSKTATLLSPLGKSWHVEVYGDSRRLYFKDGWREFAQAHDLSVGYFLVFKYVGDMVFNVTIFDPSTCEREYTPVVGNGPIHKKIRREEPNSVNNLKCVSCRPLTRSCVRTTDDERKKMVSHSSPTEVGVCRRPFTRSCAQTTDDETTKVISHSFPREVAKATKLVAKSRDLKTPETESAYTSKPHFIVIMKPCNLFSSSYLHIPNQFRASFDLSGIHQIILRDPKGRKWHVNLCHAKGSTFRIQIGRGWMEFCNNNNLEEGDVCIFELVSKKNIVMQVHIRKRGEHNSTNQLKDISKISAICSPRQLITEGLDSGKRHSKHRIPAHKSDISRPR